MQPAKHTPSLKPKAENKATRSCQPCSRWVGDPPCKLYKSNSDLGSDIYTLVQPARVRPVYDLLEQRLSATAHIQLHRGKARVWNASGVQPPSLTSLGADVWVGDQGLPAAEQGMIILGAPLGSDVFTGQHLNNLSATHQELLSRLPELQDLQASWLLLLFCASPRSNYILRMLPPPATAEFSTRHDEAVATCLTEFDRRNHQCQCCALGVLGRHPPHPPATASQPGPPHRPTTARPHQCIPSHPSSTVAAAHALRICDGDPPSWDTLIGHNGPPPADPEPVGPQHRGWQQPAAKATHEACRAEVYSHLPPASQALLDSQSGPYASRAFTSIPYTAESTYSSEHFRLLMLRRLRLPLPLSTRTCRCRRTLDTLGDHRSACAQSGLLRSRGGPLERAAARICREAGARVTTNTRVADLNIPNVQTLDDRRIEVIANGLPLWGGVPKSQSTPPSSPLSPGRANPDIATTLAATKSGSIQSSPVAAAVASSSWGSKLEDGGARKLAPSSASWHNAGHDKPHHCSGKQLRQLCFTAGPPHAHPCGFHGLCGIPPGLGLRPTSKH